MSNTITKSNPPLNSILSPSSSFLLETRRTLPIKMSTLPKSYYIRTPRLILRTPQLSDAPSITAFYSDPPNVVLEPHKPKDPSKDHYARQIPIWLEMTKKGERAVMVVCLPSSTTPISGVKVPRVDEVPTNSAIALGAGQVPPDHMIGFCGINEFKRQDDGVLVCNTGVAITTKERNKGYAVEALSGIFEYAYHELGAEVMELETLAANGPFRGLMKYLRLDSYGKEVDGDHGREVRYRMTRDQWLEAKRSCASSIS